LTDYEVLIDTAIEKGLLAKKDKELVLSWNKNPRKWGKTKE
jgi:hypothetical protein